jgi:hypothetical protein
MRKLFHEKREDLYDFYTTLEGDLAFELNPNEFQIEWAWSNKTTIIVMDTISCNVGWYGMNLIGE